MMYDQCANNGKGAVYEYVQKKSTSTSNEIEIMNVFSHSKTRLETLSLASSEP